MKTITITAKLTVPFVEGFDDYHDIYYKRDCLREDGFGNLKAKEVGFDGLYWGFFYVDKLPPKKEIYKLLLESGFQPEEE